jgi:hypothetical protein
MTGQISMAKHIDRLYIVLGALYLVIGMVLGIVMGIRQDFLLSPVHAHINLVGFAAHGIFGLVYKAWPELKDGVIAAAQFWLFVVGAPLLMVGITIAIKTNNPALAIVGSMLVILGALLFLIVTGRRLLRTSAD